MILSIDKLRKLAMAATPGRWRSHKSVHGNQYRYVQIGKEENYTTLELESADADFIAAANPQAILALLDRLEKAEANQRTEFSIEKCGKCGLEWCDEWTGDKCYFKDVPAETSPCPIVRSVLKSRS